MKNIIDKRKKIKKINSMISLHRYVEMIVSTKSDMKVMNKSEDYITIRFSKTIVRQQYKNMDIIPAVELMMNSFMIDVYRQVVNNPIVFNYMENNELSLNDVMDNSDLLFEVLYTNAKGNILILKIKNPE